MNPLVSLIIPVYNLENYLSLCLESLENISYEKIEIIFVNDGSTDKSIEILNKYKKKSLQKVIIIDQINQGVSIARNNGLAQASGKYILFIDGDDYIENNLVTECVDKAIKDQSELVIFGYYIENNKTNKTVSKIITINEQLLDNEAFSKHFFDIYNQVSINSPWNKMYLRDFIIEHKIKFPNQKMGEDGIFNALVYAKVNKVSILSLSLYHYITERPGSAQSKYKVDYINDEINLINSYYNLFEKWGWSNDLETLFSKFIIDAQYKALKNLAVFDGQRVINIEHLKKIKKSFSSLNKLIKKKNISIKQKLKWLYINFVYKLS